MSEGPTLRIGTETSGGDESVPAPVPPDDPEAWYAPDVRAQYESAPGVVATVRERDGGRFGYDVREPPLSPADERALDRVRDRFSAVRHRRPLTRVGVVERAERGFDPKYAVLEPDLLPGDEALIEECKSRIWETTVSDVVEDRESFVAARARRFLSRRLTARNTRAWLDAAAYRARAALAERGLVAPPVDSRFARDRLDDLAYYILRDLVGEGILTVPIRDPHLEDVEANRVGERVKVVPRASVLSETAEEATAGGEAGVDADPPAAGERVPTNLSFDDETTFVNVVTGIAARDGTELNASTPSAKVNLELDGVPQTIRCAVALPVISEGGPHVSIRKQRADALTPVDLIERGALSVDLVTLLWLLYEHRGVVLFAGPTGVGKTTLLNAHAPFIPFDARPVSVDEGSREVRLPHETGVSLTTRDHEDAYKSVGMAELMTEANYLNPSIAY